MVDSFYKTKWTEVSTILCTHSRNLSVCLVFDSTTISCSTRVDVVTFSFPAFPDILPQCANVSESTLLRWRCGISCGRRCPNWLNRARPYSALMSPTRPTAATTPSEAAEEEKDLNFCGKWAVFLFADIADHFLDCDESLCLQIVAKDS